MHLTFNINHIDSPKHTDKNYSIESLDVAPDFPISISKEGKILSIYSDAVWDITPYSNRNTRFYFNLKTSSGKVIDSINLYRYKKLLLWLMYAWRYPLSSNSIKNLSVDIRALLKLCIDNQIDISQLSRFPAVIDQIRTVIKNSRWGTVRLILQMAYVDREILGFFLLTNEQVDEIDKHYACYLTKHQTAFIPERIFNNLITRCMSLIDGYTHHQSQIETLYKRCLQCLDEVRAEFGRHKGLGTVTTIKKRRIGAIEYYAGKKFDALAEEYGAKDAMMQVCRSNREMHVASLSSYLTHVSLSARILIAAFSGMREKEHGSLQEGCHTVRNDELLGEIHFLLGVTTKTVKDRNAYWVTSPLIGPAIKVAESIAKLRREAANIYGGQTSNKSNNPYLFPLTSDPWIGGSGPKESIHKYSVPVKSGSLRNVLVNTPLLFPGYLLKIGKEDIENATRMNPDLDLSKFSIDECWPLAWHQFRRTFVCLALGAGVSLPTLTWQLKHAGTAMTLHYGNNYFSAPLDINLKKEFERAQIEIFLIKKDELKTEKYVTANGINKEAVLRTIKSYDNKSLKKAIQNGQISIKPTALGVCTNTSPCGYGGWENVTECVKCANGLILKTNNTRIKRMLEVVETDLAECDENDLLLSQSLNAQKNAIMEALSVIN